MVAKFNSSDYLLVVIGLCLIMSGDVELNPGPLNGELLVIMTSIIIMELLSLLSKIYL